MPLIILFGSDGAGKTTLAKNIAVELQKLGYNVVNIKMKLHHLLMFLVLKFLQKINVIPQINSPRVLEYSLRSIFKNSKMFVFLEFLNIILWYIFFAAPKLRKKNVIVIADRFSPDSIVALSVITPRIPQILEKVLLMLCRNAIAIYVYGDIKTLILRKREEMLSETYLKYIMVQYSRVLNMLKQISLKLDVIDTTKLTEFQASQLLLEKIKPLILKVG